MYTKIMVPLDLAHANTINKAVRLAADLGKHYSAEVYFVGVTATAPGEAAHSPEEYAEKLEQFAAAKSSEHGIQFQAKTMISHDPVIDLDDTLRKAGEEIGVDLVIMASHIPGFMDYFLSSNAGYLAAHSNISIFVVR